MPIIDTRSATSNKPVQSTAGSSRRPQKSLVAIVKPTNRCNLACEYCYAGPCVDPATMPKEKVHDVMSQVIRAAKGRAAHFIWHGGEPLLCGLEFFRQVLTTTNELRSAGHKVTNSIQTNGTLLTEEFVEFFADVKEFRLGLSLDGPKFLNDQTRVFLSGDGAYDRIMDAARRLRDHPARRSLGGGVIVVVTSVSIRHLTEIYSFFKTERINIKFNPVVMSGRATDKLAVSAEDYGQAMNRLFDIWIDDPDTIDIDPFSSMMGNLLAGRPAGCNFSQSCARSFVAITQNGDIYPCGRFDGMQEFRMGRISDEGGVEAAINSPLHQTLQARSAQSMPECIACKYSHLCNGGCMHNACMAGNSLGRDPFCAAYKLMYSHIEEFLTAEIAKAEANEH